MNDAKALAERARVCLQQAVAEELEKKRRLGQYAVFFRDGKPVRVDLNDPAELGNGSNAHAAGDGNGGMPRSPDHPSSSSSDDV